MRAMGLTWFQTRYSCPVPGDTSIVTVSILERPVSGITLVLWLNCVLQLLCFAKCKAIPMRTQWCQSTRRNRVAGMTTCWYCLQEQAKKITAAPGSGKGLNQGQTETIRGGIGKINQRSGAPDFSNKKN